MAPPPADLDGDLASTSWSSGPGSRGSTSLARWPRPTRCAWCPTRPRPSGTLESDGYLSAGYDGNDVNRIQPARRAAAWWRLWAESNGVPFDPEPDLVRGARATSCRAAPVCGPTPRWPPPRSTSCRRCSRGGSLAPGRALPDRHRRGHQPGRGAHRAAPGHRRPLPRGRGGALRAVHRRGHRRRAGAGGRRAGAHRGPLRGAGRRRGQRRPADQAQLPVLRPGPAQVDQGAGGRLPGRAAPVPAVRPRATCRRSAGGSARSPWPRTPARDRARRRADLGGLAADRRRARPRWGRPTLRFEPPIDSARCRRPRRPAVRGQPGAGEAGAATASGRSTCRGAPSTRRWPSPTPRWWPNRCRPSWRSSASRGSWPCGPRTWPTPSSWATRWPSASAEALGAPGHLCRQPPARDLGSSAPELVARWDRPDFGWQDWPTFRQTHACPA